MSRHMASMTQRPNPKRPTPDWPNPDLLPEKPRPKKEKSVTNPKRPPKDDPNPNKQ
jgi:hypothetical protein